MVDSVKNMSTLLKAMEESLKESPSTSAMTIERMGEANEDPSRATEGWLGLYIDAVVYTPSSVGTGSRRWEMEPKFRLIVQAVDYEDSKNAHAKLEKYIKNAVDVILDNRTLKSNVDALSEISIEYAFDERREESLYFIGALVTMDFIGKSA